MLEVVATEFSCQGLELDFVGACWGGDLIRGGEGWCCRALSGTEWRNVNDAAEREWIRNTYRVLLTRARYETVIWVPRGSRRGDPWYDATRDAAELDAVADFLLACGAQPIEEAATAPMDAAPQPALL
jgi:hypothetical protein